MILFATKKKWEALVFILKGVQIRGNKSSIVQGLNKKSRSGHPQQRGEMIPLRKLIMKNTDVYNAVNVE